VEAALRDEIARGTLTVVDFEDYLALFISRLVTEGLLVRRLVRGELRYFLPEYVP
jgi:hypothetical protein